MNRDAEDAQRRNVLPKQKGQKEAQEGDCANPFPILADKAEPDDRQKYSRPDRAHTHEYLL
jgi:hypothetical protein